MRLLQSLLAVLTQLLLQAAVVHVESSISSPLQAVLTANNELFSVLVDHDVYTDPTRSAENVLQIFPGLSRFTALVFSTAPLLDFIASSPEESHPAQETIREMISKIDSSLSQGTILGNTQVGVWDHYISVFYAEDTAIKKAWKFFKNFLKRALMVKTMEEKSRLAGKFTSFYTQAKMEDSVAMLYQKITAGKLNVVCDASSKNFYLLGRYSSYLSTLMVLGLQMRVYYYTLTDTSLAAAKAEAAMTQLSDIYLTMQNVQINCLESFISGISDNVLRWRLASQIMAEKIKEDLGSRFDWCNWTVTNVWGNEEPPADFATKIVIDYSTWAYVSCTPRQPLQPCTEELCPSQSGHCRNVTALGGDICQCAKMFYGPKCEKSIQDDIDQSVLGQGDNPIIVPDLFSIYYSIMDLKALLTKPI